MVDHIQDFVAAFSDPMERLLPVIRTASANLGETVPLWASFLRLFWLAFILLFGTILGIRNLFRFKGLDSTETLETGGLWGVLIFSVISILAFPGGTQMHRILMYPPLFTVPIIMRFLADFKPRQALQTNVFNKFITKPWNWSGKHALVIISVVFLILSLPTFLDNHDNVNTISVYKYELSAGEFVEASYDAESLHFISDILTVYTNVYYVPDANFSHPPQPWEITDEAELWLGMDRLAKTFEDSRGTAVFVLTEKFNQPYRSIAPVEPTDPRWIEFTGRISEKDMIYNNGHTRIFINQPAQ
jgi:hypothetical protein